MSSDLPDETLRLAFPAFVRAACDWVEGIEWILEDDDLFHFVRAIKGHDHTRAMDAAKAYGATTQVAERMRGERPEILCRLADEDGEVAFFSMWERVRFPMGADPVEVACSVAATGFIRTNKTRPGRYERFLTVAALLQIQVGAKPILLPVRKIAQHFPCEPNTVTAWIKWAREDGVLIKVKEHSFRSAGESQAAEYLLGLHQWDAALPRLSELIRIPVRPQDLKWLEREFAGPAAS